MNDSTDTKYVKVFIGRFQPFHNGHLKCLRAAIDTADHVVLVIGSAATPVRTLKNPWTYTERWIMILGALTVKEREKVSIIPMFDLPGQDREWVKAVKTAVNQAVCLKLGAGLKLAFTLIGCHKGADTYYLKLYRGWGRDLIPKNEAMNATDVRRLYFDGFSQGRGVGLPGWSAMVPGSTFSFLMLWQDLARPEYLAIMRESEALNRKERDQQIETLSKEPV